MKTKTDPTNDVRVKLDAELRLVVSRLRGLGAQVSREMDDAVLDGGSNPLDTFDNAEFHIARESLFASRERLSERAQQLSAALGRVQDGSYGICVECGEPIGAARLRAIPEVATCITCQERLDRTRPQGARRLATGHLRDDEVAAVTAEVEPAMAVSDGAEADTENERPRTVRPSGSTRDRGATSSKRPPSSRSRRVRTAA